MNKPIALTPPMGWNSWNTFTWDINEKMICEMADRMVEDGYLEAGYEYLVIDDCWSLKQRDADGNLVPDPEKFPHGMKWVSDYVHGKHLPGYFAYKDTLVVGVKTQVRNNVLDDSEIETSDEAWKNDSAWDNKFKADGYVTFNMNSRMRRNLQSGVWII